MYFGPYNFVQISPACGPNTYQIMYGETLRLSMSALATVAGESFNGKFTAKIDFRWSILYYHADFEIISIWTTCW